VGFPKIWVENKTLETRGIDELERLLRPNLRSREKKGCLAKRKTTESKLGGGRKLSGVSEHQFKRKNGLPPHSAAGDT